MSLRVPVRPNRRRLHFQGRPVDNLEQLLGRTRLNQADSIISLCEHILEEMVVYFARSFAGIG